MLGQDYLADWWCAFKFWTEERKKVFTLNLLEGGRVERQIQTFSMEIFVREQRAFSRKR